jgi:hypothetical protein
MYLIGVLIISYLICGLVVSGYTAAKLDDTVYGKTRNDRDIDMVIIFLSFCFWPIALVIILIYKFFSCKYVLKFFKVLSYLLSYPYNLGKKIGNKF